MSDPASRAARRESFRAATCSSCTSFGTGMHSSASVGIGSGLSGTGHGTSSRTGPACTVGSGAGAGDALGCVDDRLRLDTDPTSALLSAPELPPPPALPAPEALPLPLLAPPLPPTQLLGPAPAQCDPYARLLRGEHRCGAQRACAVPDARKPSASRSGAPVPSVSAALRSWERGEAPPPKEHRCGAARPCAVPEAMKASLSTDDEDAPSPSAAAARGDCRHRGELTMRGSGSLSRARLSAAR
mmetsp:Transcript_13384/g.44700  ORF Transcript_13384/g.44700 Transcript_13384/m.44700 type:complete len:243 (-) Transcript_13384:107-835(-)